VWCEERLIQSAACASYYQTRNQRCRPRRASPAGRPSIWRTIFIHYDMWLIPRPVTLATSTAFPGCWIGRVDGVDWASTRHFAKKAPNFLEINPHSE
jgi:hypothetical protein